MLSLAGLVLWKWWEAQTPAEEQFSVAEGVFKSASNGGHTDRDGRDSEDSFGDDDRDPLFRDARNMSRTPLLR